MSSSVRAPGRNTVKWRRTPQKFLPRSPIRVPSAKLPTLTLMPTADDSRVSGKSNRPVLSSFLLSQNKTVIGRDAAACDVCLDSSLQTRMVSKVHAIIHRTKNVLTGNFELYIVDCNSTNGTYVNGARVAKSVSLSDNDIVTFGRFKGSEKSRSRVSELSYHVSLPQAAWSSSRKASLVGTPPLHSQRHRKPVEPLRTPPKIVTDRSGQPGVVVVRAPSRGNPLRKTDALLQAAFPQGVNWMVRPNSTQRPPSSLASVMESRNPDMVLDFAKHNPGLQTI